MIWAGKGGERGHSGAVDLANAGKISLWLGSTDRADGCCEGAYLHQSVGNKSAAK